MHRCEERTWCRVGATEMNVVSVSSTHSSVVVSIRKERERLSSLSVPTRLLSTFDTYSGCIFEWLVVSHCTDVQIAFVMEHIFIYNEQ